MPRFYFVFSAQGVLIDRHGADPVIGFVAMREGRGCNIDDAERFARIELLKQWKTVFNQDNKAGTPSITLVHSSRIRNPFKKVRARDDFCFFSDGEKGDSIARQAANAASSWWTIR